MIISVSDLKAANSAFGAKYSDTELERKLNALELMIRKYTNNKFQKVNIRFTGESSEDKVYGDTTYFAVGDTVEISQTDDINDGLYLISAVDSEYLQLDTTLFDYDENVVTKIIYPYDIQEGIINLMLWDVNNREKTGVKSESISRHSVTYFDLDKNNQVMGYPVSLLGFLKPYMKARF
jgi:hypothetical protein